MANQEKKSNVSTPARILALVLSILVTSTTVVFLVQFILNLFGK